MDGPAHRTLERALEIVGTKEELAAILDTSVAAIEEYLASRNVPDQVFFKALDVVAKAPSMRKARKD